MFAFLNHIAISLPVWAVYALALVPPAIFIAGLAWCACRCGARADARQQRWEDFGEGAGGGHAEPTRTGGR